MINFDLIFDECKKLNNSLKAHFPTSRLCFIGANIHEIAYALDYHTIVFGYYPERYEIGKIMNLKDLRIRLVNDKRREYSIIQVMSFLQNDCKLYVETYNIHLPGELLELLKTFLSSKFDSINRDWEEKFISYQKKITDRYR